MILLEELLFEDFETEGTNYEKQVIDSLAAAGMLKDEVLSVGSDRHREDATFVLNDNMGNVIGPYKLEIKKDFKAQLGGSSWDISNPKDIRFLSDLGTSRTMLKVHDEMKAVLEAALGTGGALKRLRRFLKNFKAGTYIVKGKKFKETKEGEAYNLAGEGLKCTRLAWAAAQEQGLLEALNINVLAHAKFMTTLYSQKGVYYVQVGGKENDHRGFYILGADPANLSAIGVPRLSNLASKNKFFVEMRATPGGSGTYLYLRIRCQGRLHISTPIPEDYSPFTVDTPAGAKHLMRTYKEASPPKRKRLQTEAKETFTPSDVTIDSIVQSDEPIEDVEVYTPDNVDLDWLSQGGYEPITQSINQ
jgi:hypothetical protein